MQLRWWWLTRVTEVTPSAEPHLIWLVSRTDSRATNKALARHETVNKRLKQFKVLKEQFRHPLYKHKDCIYASAAATQVMFNRGEKPYKVTY